VNRIFSNTDAIVIGLEDVDLEKAKCYVGHNFYINRELLGDKILFEDLKGSSVYFEDDSKLGKIVDVQDYGTAEVISVVTEKGLDLMFPNVKGVIVSFDYKEKKLILNKDKFKEVADYED
jgi:ribosomal 30S subunit maturation factor RimM